MGIRFTRMGFDTLKSRAAVAAISASFALTSLGLCATNSLAFSDNRVTNLQYRMCAAGGSTADDTTITTGGAAGPC